jgi:acyl carrier protein phosphodiesterase
VNFLAHLHLSRHDPALMYGGLLGDFVRGRAALDELPPGVRDGVLLHRHIDGITDDLPPVRELRTGLEAPFRRYGGIIIDLAFDHVLARDWSQYEATPLPAFDREVRTVAERYRARSPERLRAFLRYADQRGLFASYAREEELLRSLAGIGGRLSRPNPLHRVREIWPGLRDAAGPAFADAYPRLQSAVSDWLNTRSTSTGS